MNPKIYLPLFLAACTTSQAATMAVTQNIVTFLTSPSSTSGLTRDVLFDDGTGNTVTLRFVVTTQSGEAFNSRQNNTLVGVGSGNDGKEFDSTEDVTFAVNYLSHTGNIDLNSIAFQFEAIGFQNNEKKNASDVRWTSSGITGGKTITTANKSNAYVSLDTGFTTIGSSGSYTGTFENLSSVNVGQLSRVAAGGGLKFQMEYQVITPNVVIAVPEPSGMLLGGVGALTFLLRRSTRRS